MRRKSAGLWRLTGTTRAKALPCSFKVTVLPALSAARISAGSAATLVMSSFSVGSRQNSNLTFPTPSSNDSPKTAHQPRSRCAFLWTWPAASRRLRRNLSHGGYQSLIKAYVSEGLRRDEARFTFTPDARLVQALRKHGVSIDLIEQALQEAGG